MNNVTEMRLCETEHVILKADQLYIFSVHPGCMRCKEMADSREGEAGDGPENIPPAEGGTDVATGSHQGLRAPAPVSEGSVPGDHRSATGGIGSVLVSDGVGAMVAGPKGDAGGIHDADGSGGREQGGTQHAGSSAHDATSSESDQRVGTVFHRQDRGACVEDGARGETDRRGSGAHAVASSSPAEDVMAKLDDLLLNRIANKYSHFARNRIRLLVQELVDRAERAEKLYRLTASFEAEHVSTIEALRAEDVMWDVNRLIGNVGDEEIPKTARKQEADELQSLVQGLVEQRDIAREVGIRAGHKECEWALARIAELEAEVKQEAKRADAMQTSAESSFEKCKTLRTRAEEWRQAAQAHAMSAENAAAKIAERWHRQQIARLKEGKDGPNR